MPDNDTDNHSHLIPLLEQLRGAHVLCVGDVMLDRFVYGVVDRISPEAPIPVLKVAEEISMLGGAGNVVRNLTALGCQASLIAVTGSDDAATRIGELLEEQSLTSVSLVPIAGRQTSVKTRLLTHDQHLLRADRDDESDLSEADVDKIRQAALKGLKDADALLLSDYGKGVLSPTLIADLITAANAMGKPVIVDPKGADYSRYRGAQLLTPNRKELSEASQMAAISDAEVASAAQAIIEASGVGAILATRSGDGMTVVSSHDVTHIPVAAPLEIFDVSGAGDTVVALMAAGLGSGIALDDVARIANVAAGIVVGKIGTATVYPDELVGALRTEDLVHDDRKIVTLEQAIDEVTRWRNKGLSVGMTNGCFDIVHPGHISLLNQSSSQCDRLVVALNTDASVKRLKGESRPVQQELARATVIAHMRSVALVVLFDEDTPINVIESLKPDVLIKGSDYTVDQVVGADIVQAYGGRVYLAELVDGHSTTATVAKIAQR